jgi:hypothetical protein
MIWRFFGGDPNGFWFFLITTPSQRRRGVQMIESIMNNEALRSKPFSTVIGSTPGDHRIPMLLELASFLARCALRSWTLFWTVGHITDGDSGTQ